MTETYEPVDGPRHVSVHGVYLEDHNVRGARILIAGRNLPTLVWGEYPGWNDKDDLGGLDRDGAMIVSAVAAAELAIWDEAADRLNAMWEKP